MASFEWIDTDGRFRLSVRPRPSSPLDRDLAEWRSLGVNRIVSLQTEDEAARMGLANEAQVADSLGIVFERFAIRDHEVPVDDDAALCFARQTLDHLIRGQSTILHCYAGIGRSGLMAILILMIAGYSLADARQRASEARRFPLPENNLQLRWLTRIGSILAG